MTPTKVSHSQPAPSNSTTRKLYQAHALLKPTALRFTKMTTFRTVTGSDFGRAIRSARSKPASGLKQAIFARLCVEAGLPEPVAEYRFHGVGMWGIELAWVDQKVGLEIDGGIWSGGRHTRGAGWLKDTEKLNTLACMGWRMLRCTPSDLCRTETVEMVREAVDASGTA